jgi:hypothetical protein
VRVRDGALLNQKKKRPARLRRRARAVRLHNPEQQLRSCPLLGRQQGPERRWFASFAGTPSRTSAPTMIERSWATFTVVPRGGRAWRRCTRSG